MTIPKLNTKDQYTPAFNMGIATLERINNILIASSENNINSDINKSRKILKELLKESIGFLNNTERIKCRKLWGEIAEKAVNFEDSNTIRYDITLINVMDELDFYLRDILYSKGVLMPNLARMKGLNKLEDSYKIEKGED